MLWCIVYLFYIVMLNKARTQVMRIADGVQIFDKHLMFNVFRRTKHWEYLVLGDRHKAEEVRKYFVNPKIENEVLG